MGRAVGEVTGVLAAVFVDPPAERDTRGDYLGLISRQKERAG